MAIDINTADVNDLKKIPGLGNKKAQELIRYRDENGDFDNWEEVKNVPGFSEETVQILQRGGVSLGGQGGNGSDDEEDEDEEEETKTGGEEEEGETQ